MYEQLVQIDDSPVIALNRAVAIAELHGPRAGVEAVEAVQNNRQLESNDLLYAVLAEFESQLNDLLAAASLDSIIYPYGDFKMAKTVRELSTLLGSRN